MFLCKGSSLKIFGFKEDNDNWRRLNDGDKIDLLLFGTSYIHYHISVWAVV